MKRLFLHGICCSIILASLASPALANDWKKIRIATEGAYPPWNFVEASGKLNGYDVDVSNDLCKRMGSDCEIVAQDWDGIIPALNAEKFDAVVAAMVITPKRQALVDFTIPYAKGARSFITLKDSPLGSIAAQSLTLSLETDAPKVQAAVDALKPALQGKTIGVQVATTHVEFLEKYLKGVVEVREYKTSEAMILDLNAGRIDAAFDGIAFLGGLLGSADGQKLTFIGPRFDGGMFGIGSAIAVRKSTPDLRDKLNVALKAAIADGTLRNLSLKWFKLDISPKP